MVMIVSVVLTLALLAVSLYQIFRMMSAPDSPRDWTAISLTLSPVLALGTFSFSGIMSMDMLMLELLPACAGMLVLTSSLWKRSLIRFWTLGLSLAEISLACLNIAILSGYADVPERALLTAFSVAFLLLPPVFVSVGLILRLRAVRSVIKTGTVWDNMSLSMEMLYLLIFEAVSFVCILLSLCSTRSPEWLVWAFPLMTGGLLVALGIKEADDVVFLIWRRQERRIVESIKVTKVESATDPSGIDDMYKDIYERLVLYFEQERPFLDNSLTINDLVKALYSNKLYISKAISQFTGRNFCQFVNYYRVTYSMNLFRDDPSMKIRDLAAASGFNSDVSYNMAFRLFMGETPGEWCRKERYRRIKQKK